MNEGRLRMILAAFPVVTNVRAVAAVAAARGLSGAEVWRVELPAATFALRAWPPEHPSPNRLRWIHQVLAHVDRFARQQGWSLPLPVPIATATGETFVAVEGRLWELAPWLPGQADEQHPPCPARVAAAFRALAQFHRAAATCDIPYPEPGWPCGVGPSPGLVQRHEQITHALRTDWHDAERAIRAGAGGWPELAEFAWQWLRLARRCSLRVAGQLAGAMKLSVPIFPCLRDIKRDHVFFQGDAVSGVVDFGALRPETVAADLARLLGSFDEDSGFDRAAAVASYHAVRPLSESERALIDVFHDSSSVLGGAQWVEWIWRQGRSFADRKQVEARFRAIVTRLATFDERR